MYIEIEHKSFYMYVFQLFDLAGYAFDYFIYLFREVFGKCTNNKKNNPL